MRSILLKLNCLKIISLRERMREITTNDKPAANSLLPRSINAFSKVRPYDLWAVMAHERESGSCS